MNKILFLAFLLPSLSFADAPKIVFGQDPLCDSEVGNPKALEQARSFHQKYPFFRPHVADQNKWFIAVTKEMRAICDEDKKFAQEILKRDRSQLTGQCKPAAEAAMYDQEVLEHSEASLKRLRSGKEDFLTKGRSGQTESLVAIFQRNHETVDDEALFKNRAPRDTACELRWIYPKAIVALKPPYTGCPEAPPSIKIAEMDKNDPGLFGRMMTRFDLSITYNTERRNNAFATAQASKARYEACVAEHPGTENVLVKSRGVGKSKSATGPAPSGQSPKQSSDITGIKEDEEKRKQKK